MAENTKIARKSNKSRDFPVAANTVIRVGEAAGVNAGNFAVPVAAGVTIRGVCFEKEANNVDGANGDITVNLSCGSDAFLFVNDTTNPCTKANIGSAASFVNPNTVGTTGGVAGGRIHDVDEAGVWVIFD